MATALAVEAPRGAGLARPVERLVAVGGPAAVTTLACATGALGAGRVRVRRARPPLGARHRHPSAGRRTPARLRHGPGHPGRSPRRPRHRHAPHPGAGRHVHAYGDRRRPPSRRGATGHRRGQPRAVRGLGAAIPRPGRVPVGRTPLAPRAPRKPAHDPRPLPPHLPAHRAGGSATLTRSKRDDPPFRRPHHPPSGRDARGRPARWGGPPPVPARRWRPARRRHRGTGARLMRVLLSAPVVTSGATSPTICSPTRRCSSPNSAGVTRPTSGSTCPPAAPGR